MKIKTSLKQRLAALALSSVAALATGCFAETAENQELDLDSASGSSWDVNDISILYPLKPLHRKNEPGKMIKLQNAGGKDLISQAHFDRIMRIFRTQFSLDFSRGAQASKMNTLDKWSVVGIRTDHCFRKHIEDPCMPQVRLVVQAMGENDVVGTDFAMHLAYLPQITTEEFLKESIRIRETYAKPANKKLTIGKPLGIHPILKREGMNSDYAKALKDELILKHLNPQNLMGIAVAWIEPDRLQPWIFFGTDARDWNKPLNHSIFMFDPGTSINDCGVQSNRLICRRDSSGRIIDSQERMSSPFPSGRTPGGVPYLDDFLTLTRTDPDLYSFKSVNKDIKMWQGVFNEIENPKMTGVEDTNCSSCHRTHTDRVRFKDILDLDVNGINAFQVNPSSGCTSGSGLNTNESGIETINVRMFGYLHYEPIISQRVINETLDVCQHLKNSIK